MYSGTVGVSVKIRVSPAQVPQTTLSVPSCADKCLFGGSPAPLLQSLPLSPDRVGYACPLTSQDSGCLASSSKEARHPHAAAYGVPLNSRACAVGWPCTPRLHTATGTGQ